MSLLLRVIRPGDARQPTHALHAFEPPAANQNTSLTYQVKTRLRRMISKQSIAELVSIELKPTRPPPAPPLSPLSPTPRRPSVTQSYHIRYSADLGPDPRASSMQNEQQRVNKVATGYSKDTEGKKLPALPSSESSPQERFPHHPDDYWVVHQTERKAITSSQHKIWRRSLSCLSESSEQGGVANHTPKPFKLASSIAEQTQHQPLWQLAEDRHSPVQGRPESFELDTDMPVYPATRSHQPERTGVILEEYSADRNHPDKVSLAARPNAINHRRHGYVRGMIANSSQTLGSSAPGGQTYVAFDPRKRTSAGLELRRLMDEVLDKTDSTVGTRSYQQQAESAETSFASRVLTDASSDRNATAMNESRCSLTTEATFTSFDSSEHVEFKEARVQEVTLQQAQTITITSQRQEISARGLARPLPMGYQPARFGAYRPDPAWEYSRNFRRQKREDREKERQQAMWNEQMSGELIDFCARGVDVETVCARKQPTMKELFEFWEGKSMLD